MMQQTSLQCHISHVYARLDTPYRLVFWEPVLHVGEPGPDISSSAVSGQSDINSSASCYPGQCLTTWHWWALS